MQANSSESVKKSEQQLAALISMIDEPNEQVFATIRQKIADYGRLAIPLLEDAWMNSFSEEHNERLEALIEDIRFEDLYRDMESWTLHHQDDLLSAFLLIGKFRYPDFNEGKYLEIVDKIKKDAWLEMNDELTALEKTKVLNHILYDVHGFRGIPPQKKIALNSYFLNEVLDTKRGNALSLGILYIIVAQSLNIPVFGVDLPQHFVLTYLEEQFPIQTSLKQCTRDDVLFYINAMNKGAVFTANEVELFLEKAKLGSEESFFLPCDNLKVIRRLITELTYAYQVENETDKVKALEELLKLLT